MRSLESSSVLTGVINIIRMIMSGTALEMSVYVFGFIHPSPKRSQLVSSRPGGQLKILAWWANRIASSPWFSQNFNSLFFELQRLQPGAEPCIVLWWSQWIRMEPLWWISLKLLQTCIYVKSEEILWGGGNGTVDGIFWWGVNGRDWSSTRSTVLQILKHVDNS